MKTALTLFCVFFVAAHLLVTTTSVWEGKSPEYQSGALISTAILVLALAVLWR